MARASRGHGDSPGPLARLRAALPFPSRTTRVGRSGAGPRVAFTREDARRLNERFAMLDRAERRAIVRAVNRGEVMTKRRDAELAVGVARRQQRFWSRAWLLGPTMAVVQVLITPIGWVEGLYLAAWGALLLGMMAAWWWTRARRSELLNLALIGPRVTGSRGARGGSGGPSGGPNSSSPRRRLPSTGGARDTDDGEPSAMGGSDAERRTDDDPYGPRPPRPRGRKRR